MKKILAFLALCLVIVGVVAGIGCAFTFGNIFLGIGTCALAVAAIPTIVKLFNKAGYDR